MRVPPADRSAPGVSRCLFRRAAAVGACFTLVAAMTASAGDILRGGSPAGGRSGGSGGRTNGAGTEPLRQNAKDALARTTQALQSVKAMQNAARQAARGSNNLGLNPNNPGQRLPNVPNGLGVGGLQVADGVPADLANPQPGENSSLWTGAKLPTQKEKNGHTTVTIEQMVQQALLNWKTFNIGKDTTLRFDQSRGGKDAGKWIVFNKVNDPTGVPSQILGSIKAEGQVYVINQNGIIFGGSSQVNVHALVASTLPLNDNLLKSGVLNNPDKQFLFSSLPIPRLGANGTMDPFQPPAAPNTPDGLPGDVIVQKGARLTAPTTADKVGGRIALIGANVKNEGTISTPDGQTILAAGQQVGFAAHASADATLRGLDVLVGAAGAGTGTVTNNGLIEAQRANVTMAGKTVNQNGFIESSTTVDLNGRVDLLASYGHTVLLNAGSSLIFPTQTGVVNLGADSVIRILPDWASTDTVVGLELALNSQVNMLGLAVHMGTNAQLLAPSADVTLRAGTWRPEGSSSYRFIADKGQIYLDSGAEINTAGSFDIAASITQNIIGLELRGSELADSPLQRNGILRAVMLYLDLRKSGSYNGMSWVGTPLGDASGFAGLVERTVGQLTTQGGTVSLTAGEAVVMQPGSVIDVSGGWVNFDGGMIQTTRVMSGGQLLDISNATPDRIYDGIYDGQFSQTSSKWGITETFGHPLDLLGKHWEEGYTQGANAGAISITSPSMALDGTLRGNTVEGPRQRATPVEGGALTLAFKGKNSTLPSYPDWSPTPPAIVFQPTSTLAAANAFALDSTGTPVALRADRKDNVVLSPELLTTHGFKNLTIDNSDGSISLPSGVDLVTAPGGDLVLTAGNITINGNVTAPGGTISFTALNASPYAAGLTPANQIPTNPAPDPDRGIFTLAAGSRLSTAGLIVDDRPGASDQGTLPLVIDGGSISINAYSAFLAAGSQVDASGGVSVSNAGRIAYGRGGSITVRAGRDPLLSGVFGGQLDLSAQLTAYSGSTPGSLTLQASRVQIGGTTDEENVLLLTPEFFNRGGFGSFTIGGIGAAGNQAGEFLPAIRIVAGTTIAPQVTSWLALPHQPENGGVVLVPYLKPKALRGDVSLTFLTPGARDSFIGDTTGNLLVRGDFLLEQGAIIDAGARGRVTITGDTVSILGAIRAPGGTISITGASAFPLLGVPDRALTTVYLGPQAIITAAGEAVLTPDLRGIRTGSILAGGSISVAGNIVASSGSFLDVSGTSGTLDVHPSLLSLNSTLAFQDENRLIVPTSSGLTSPLYNFGLFVPAQVDSDGGSITLRGAQFLFTDATLLGAAGGEQALGGRLTVSSGRFVLPGGAVQTPGDVTLTVTQSGPAIIRPIVGSAIGQALLDNLGAVIPQHGYFAADSFHRGGFDSLTLRGTVEFSGDVTIDARRSLSVADGGILYANGDVNLNAAYVSIGMPFIAPQLAEQKTPPFQSGTGSAYYISPTYGTGRLTVRADLIDIGNLSLQNIGRANFIADNGDIRGNGTLDVAGDIYMRAGQIYPPTAVSFTISAADYIADGVAKSGSVTIDGSGIRQLPLSAGGQLNIYASIIDQGGVLRAPLGSITLGWDGTGTAPKGALSNVNVATTEQLTLGKGSVTSVSAIEPIGGQALLIPYGIDVNGVTWIDPTGLDITAGGLPLKKINLSAAAIDTQKGSTLDLRGGGDFYAYQWVKGIGGSRDILASTTSFAIIPGYATDYAPYAPYNPNGSNLGGDAGYVNGTLTVGDRIYLSGTDSLDAGYYTLLPARYALMPGAFLVTPKSGGVVGSVKLPDDSWVVSGYRYNSANNLSDGGQLMRRFEVVSGSDVRDRAQYNDFLGNATLRQSAIALGQKPPRVGSDAGQLVIQASTALTLAGRVTAGAAPGNRGGLVDISSPVDILIAGPGVSGAPGQLVLNSADLSRFGAESLLIGGTRTAGANGTTLTVKTGNITVDNAGAALRGAEIILAAKQGLTLADGATVQQAGRLVGGGDNLLIGSTTDPGDGVLLRVTSDANAQILRSARTTSTVPNMVIGANATVRGNSITLDSTARTTIDPTANLLGNSIALNSGRISIQLDAPGALQPDAGLVLSGPVLQNLQTAQNLSLLSYSTIDIYGTGSLTAGKNLALQSGEIRGFNNGGGTVNVSAETIRLENRANATGPGATAAMSGTLNFDAATILLGANQLKIDQFATVGLNATGGILAQGTGGLTVQGDLTALTPTIAATKQATQAITAGGALTILAPATGTATVRSGLGASLALQGASAVIGSDIVLPSGTLSVRAVTGDLTVNGRLDTGGTAQSFYDVVKYTDGGEIKLLADAGAVNLAAGSVVNVAAAAEGGDAGRLTVKALGGDFTIAGTVAGQAGAGGAGGNFVLDARSLPDFGSLASALTNGGFSESQTIRVRTGDVVVNTNVKAHHFNLSTDQGAITVGSTIDASGAKGGTITLAANQSVTLLDGSVLSVAATGFSSAGKGGAVTLETRGAGGGSVDVQTGSTIDLRVASKTAQSASLGRFSGTLHLRAPQINGSTDLAISAVNGTILDASKIVAEGYQVFDLTGSGGAITSQVRADVRANGEAFLGTAGTTTASYTAMMNRLLANNGGLESVFILTAGAELINSAGDLTLGTGVINEAAALNDWNLAANRFGAKGSAGVLTMRAAGNLVFYNALSDGFVSANYNSLLLDANGALPANAQSYSYRLTAGADLTAVDFQQVRSLDSLGANSGSLLLGRNAGLNIGTTGPNGTTAAAVNNRFQVIRTGSGDITVSAGRDVQFLNQFSSIYTAGTKVSDPTMGGTFDLPILAFSEGTELGAIQQQTPYGVQYTLAGGQVSITAQNDIARYTRNTAGNLIADSVRQMPVNWLYRRGYVDPVTGNFGASRNGETASTTWWVDFSNFFEGVGALGGGDVTMQAGRDIANVDAVIPTNARMAKGRPNAANLVELGGGDLTVSAGRNIDAGVYYVERGHGQLSAGGSIITNSTRTPSVSNFISAAPKPSENWLPTTLFVGKSTFDVSAQGDLLLGPVANPFLLPGGYNNSFWYKTYFSTYSPESGVNVSSLGGNITLRQATTINAPNAGFDTHILQAWFDANFLLKGTSSNSTNAYYQPWLRLNETAVTPFATAFSIMPASLTTTAFSGDVNLVGGLTLSPSARGNVELLAGGAVNGLQINGENVIAGTPTKLWASSRINLSDANPASIPGVITPYAYQQIAGTSSAAARTGLTFLVNFNALFAETGATDGAAASLQAQQALHAPTPLHSGDPNPLRIYALGGDISGVTLYSPKQARVVASRDVSDVALYIQNLDDSDISIVSAGRDIIAYNNNSPLRVLARSQGNAINSDESTLAGDLQIAGPGTLEVLAGRNLDLGVGPNYGNGLGLGLVSIGNGRNPYLAFDGARIVAGAGLGANAGLADSKLDFDRFISEFIDPSSGAEASGYLSELATLMGTSGGDEGVFEKFQQLPEEERNVLALQIFYLVLRDSARDGNATAGTGTGTDGATAGSTNSSQYDRGFAAIDALFPGTYQGDISLTAREIKTKNGGDIAIFAPGGKLTVGFDVVGEQPLDQGILTESGGNISIFTHDDVIVGTSRIFTLRGGNEIIWSSEGDIAAGTSAKTVQSAPPTRVLIDPQSGDVQTDLAGLATGGGIGVLATVAGVPPGDVDLIAPNGAVDAGDAGIRVSGNLNIAATQVLNASNIATGGTSTGVPSAAPTAAAPVVAPTSNASQAASSAASEQASAQQRREENSQEEEMPSLITVEVIGYGGGEGTAPDGDATISPLAPNPTGGEDEEERRKRLQQEEQMQAPPPQ